MKKVIVILFCTFVMMGICACGNVPEMEGAIESESRLTGIWQFKYELDEEGKPTDISYDKEKDEFNYHNAEFKIFDDESCSITKDSDYRYEMSTYSGRLADERNGIFMFYEEEKVTDDGEQYPFADVWVKENAYDCISGAYVMYYKLFETIYILEQITEDPLYDEYEESDDGANNGEYDYNSSQNSTTYLTMCRQCGGDGKTHDWNPENEMHGSGHTCSNCGGDGFIEVER